jgi:hypothetical protein
MLNLQQRLTAEGVPVATRFHSASRKLLKKFARAAYRGTRTAAALRSGGAWLG